MAEFTVNPQRKDPYKNYKYRVKWDNKYVAGVSHVSALRRVTDTLSIRSGGDPSTSHLSPGRTQFEPITLTRGRTHDTEFENWANKVFHFGASIGAEVSLKDFRKDIIIELLNEAGQVALVYKVYRCWPSEYIPLSELDASSKGFAFEQITLQCEGWERDTSVPEPAEPAIKS